MHLLCLSIAFWILQVCLAAAPTESQWIVSGAVWKDDTGGPIQAHGGSILRWEDKYYWFGEDKAAGFSFHGISCYETSDLVNWTRLPNVLNPAPGTPLTSDKVIERPRVMYNAFTKTFVMFFHYDNSKYGLAQIGVATSQSVSQGWAFKRAFSPLNSQIRDLSVFVDDDGTGYVTFASDGNANLKMARLSKDYLDVEELVYEWKSVFYEATGIIKNNGIYHLIFSLQKGWDANPNKAMHATALTGPWSTARDIASPELNTYSSQNTWDLTVNGSQQVTHIYTGDRWTKEDIGNSKYIWQPLTIQDNEVKLNWYDVWSVDVKTGVVVTPEGKTYNSDPSPGNPASVSFRNITGTTTSGHDVKWCSVYYTNTDKAYKAGSVSVNGGPTTSVSYPPTGAKAILSVPIPITLLPGETNSIKLETPSSVKIKQIKVY